MSIPVIEQAKIQAEILVPLVKVLQEELGEERANTLVRKALGDVYRRLGEQWWRTQQSRHVGENMASAFAAFAKGDAIDFSVRAQSEDAYEIDITGCQYAQFYRELGEPELGFFWSAARTSRSRRVWAPTQSSRVHKPSCKAPVTAIFATGGRKTDSRLRVKMRKTQREQNWPAMPLRTRSEVSPVGAY